MARKRSLHHVRADLHEPAHLPSVLVQCSLKEAGLQVAHVIKGSAAQHLRLGFYILANSLGDEVRNLSLGFGQAFKHCGAGGADIVQRLLLGRRDGFGHGYRRRVGGCLDIVALATQYGRYGYRRITAMLRDAGWAVNAKRVERIWRREGLKVPQKQPKRSRLWLNDGSCVRLRPEHPNHVWSYDFVEDRTHDGRKYRMLNLIDEFTR